MPNPSPTPLSPNPPYSALLGPARPYSALLGPTRPEPAPLHAQPLPNPTQPYPALLGPTRPYSAPLGPNRPPRGGLAWGHLRVQLLPVQSDTAGLSASVFLPVLGSAALAQAIKYLKDHILENYKLGLSGGRALYSGCSTRHRSFPVARPEDA